MRRIIRWRPNKMQRRVARTTLEIFLLCAALIWLSLNVSWPWWTGFDARPRSETVEPAKTLWDWMALLIVPVALAIIAYWFNKGEKSIERELASDKQREDALQAYLDRMAELLLDYNLREQSDKPEISNVARVRTLTAFRRLDPARIEVIFQFLRDSGLTRYKDPESIIKFRHANLSRLNLSNIRLQDINLSYADFQYTDFQHSTISLSDLQGSSWKRTNLFKASFGECNMSGISLEEAILDQTRLVECDLRGVHIANTKINEIDVSMSILDGTNLQGASFVRSVFYMTELRGTNLSNADLQGANFTDADLSNADLQGADLGKANLERANLEGANLRGAKVTRGQLEQASSLKNTILPDGSIMD